MIKPGSLREALTRALPEYETNPQNLVIFIDKGRLVSRLAPGLGFEWRYTMRLEFRDCTSGPDEIAVPLLLWLRQHQPERLLDFVREDNALNFAADIIDEKSWDLAFAFELTEACTAQQVAGGWNVEHHPEPPIAGETPIGGSLSEVWLGETRLVP